MVMTFQQFSFAKIFEACDSGLLSLYIFVLTKDSASETYKYSQNYHDLNILIYFHNILSKQYCTNCTLCENLKLKINFYKVKLIYLLANDTYLKLDQFHLSQTYYNLLLPLE